MTSSTAQPSMGQLTFSFLARPASPSLSQDLEAAWTMNVATSPSSFAALLIDAVRGGSSGKTYLASLVSTKDETLEPSSGRFQNSGIISRGESYVLNTSEFHSAADVSFLSDILEPMSAALERYCLSATACKGILRRAEKRGKALPPILQAALIGQVQTSTLPSSDLLKKTDQ